MKDEEIMDITPQIITVSIMAILIICFVVWAFKELPVDGCVREIKRPHVDITVKDKYTPAMKRAIKRMKVLRRSDLTGMKKDKKDA